MNFVSTEHLTPQDAEACLQNLAGISLGHSAALPASLWDQIERPEDVRVKPGDMSEGMYRLLLEELPVVTFIARLGGEFNEMYISPQIETLLGFTRREWLENPVLWYERLHPDDKNRWNTEFSHFLMLDEPFSSVYRFMARDEHVVWVHGEVKMIRDDHGRPIYIQGIGFDVSEIETASQALKQAQEELERRVEERTAQLAAANEALKQAQEELERRVEERTAQLASANEALREEVAERKRSQEELQRSELQLLHSSKLAALGTLATGVAHELNQPLAAIRAIAQQLLYEEDLPEYCLEDLKLVEAQTERMVKIINHLRTFARAPKHDVAIVDINQVATNCLILIGQQLKSHNISLDLALCAEPALVSADANELEQVVLNLVTNARDALEGRLDGRITLRSRTDGASVMLEVCDNGPGVPPDCVSRIFDPFFTTKEVGKGTGLGLSISYSILTRYSGALEYHTENGAVFTVRLPLASS